jgi:hypothetical protein
LLPITEEEEITDLTRGVKVELLQECVLLRAERMRKGWLHTPSMTKRKKVLERLQE